MNPDIHKLTKRSLRGYKYIAKDKNGQWFAYKGNDVEYRDSMWVTNDGYARIKCDHLPTGLLGIWPAHSKTTVENLLAMLASNPVEAGFGTKPTAPCAPIVADPVNHPSHYTSHPSGVECITVTEHMGFCVGNAIKYCWRADLKNDAIEDLKKARWYIDREIAKREKAKSK
jgi:hypothetical protein